MRKSTVRQAPMPPGRWPSMVRLSVDRHLGKHFVPVTNQVCRKRLLSSKKLIAPAGRDPICRKTACVKGASIST